MSNIKVNRLKSYLTRTFSPLIDLSDIKDKPQIEIEKNFLSRALTAYSLGVLSGCSMEDAAQSITDGYDDNGIDAIHFEENSKCLWLIQTKFIHNGTGGVDNGDLEKFTKGVKLLIDGSFDRFNKKVKDKEDEIQKALDDAAVKIHLVMAYTAKELSKHNLQTIEDLLSEQNDSDEILFFKDFNLDKAYKSLENGFGDAAINEEVTLHNWGHIEDPYKSFYGQISGFELAVLFQKYGFRLFTENIRSFLGISSANSEISITIKEEPENFVYFNNGITILCEKIQKKIKGGSDKSLGVFECSGFSVVNGAQTLGSIGSLLETHPEQLEKIKVIVKLISLEDTNSGFGKRITIATNTQNKVDKKDFVSLDTEHARLKLELNLEGINYHYKRTNEKVLADDKNYTLDEVAFGLCAMHTNVDYSTMLKKESGKLWADVTLPYYTDIFNPQVTAIRVMNAVMLNRYVSDVMKNMAQRSHSRERSINLYGNAIVCHMVFQKINPSIWYDNNQKAFEDFYLNALPKIVDDTITLLHEKVEKNYADSMIVYVLRNYSKCRYLKLEMNSVGIESH
jgi:hypothetical protein